MERYDRQERLWTKQGQISLTKAHIWVIDKSIAILETVKNLGLAGVGKFTLSMEKNPENSFFDFEGNTIQDQLTRINPRVIVTYATEPQDPVDLIIAKPNCEHRTGPRFRNIPIIVIESHLMKGVVGLKPNGILSIPILQTHPPSGLFDIRFRPEEVWPEYQEYCNKFDMDSLDDEVQYRHVPYCVLLVKACAKCKSGGDVKATLADMQKYGDEENFKEAERQLWRLKAPPVSQGITGLMKISHTKAYVENTTARQFWNLIKALEIFVEKHNCLPVTGIIPDMVSGTEDYVELKRIYLEKAKTDAMELARYAAYDGPSSYLQAFCQNTRYLRALVAPSLEPSVRPTSEEDSEVHEDQKPLELAPISAIIGGIAGQEALKLLMAQYTPLTGTVVYDGNTQKTTIIDESMKLIN